MLTLKALSVVEVEQPNGIDKMGVVSIVSPLDAGTDNNQDSLLRLYRE
jgi:hypothetical protein